MSKYLVLCLVTCIAVLGVGLPVMAWGWHGDVRASQANGTATPFPTVAPDFTPAYFSENEEQIPTFNRLLNTPDCVLPCLWGLRPGVSTQADIYGTLQAADFLKNLDYGGSYVFRDENQDTLSGAGVGFNFADDYVPRDTSVSFATQDYIVRYMSLMTYDPADWLRAAGSQLQLSSVLASIESIPEIYVTTDSGGQLRTFFVPILFLYRSEGIFLRYVFDFSEEWDARDSNLFKTCPGLEQTVRMEWEVWDTGSVSATEAVSVFSWYPSGVVTKPTIDDVFGVSAETFVEYFRAHPDGCIESAVTDPYTS